jgi:hypothetical protein
MALIAPGAYTRAEALKENARAAVRLLAGAALLTFLAAFIEAFWSPLRGLPVEVKYAFGILMWLLVAAYFAFAGRAPRRRSGLSASARPASHAA